MCPKPAGKVTQTKCLLLLIHSVGALDPGGGCGRLGPKAQSWCIGVSQSIFAPQRVIKTCIGPCITELGYFQCLKQSGLVTGGSYNHIPVDI